MAQKKEKHNHKIQRIIFRWQMFLIVIMTILLTVIGIFVNLYYEGRRTDENLQNVAETVAGSALIRSSLMNKTEGSPDWAMDAYLRSLQQSLSSIDIISVVGADQIRHYHTNPELTGTIYDGTIPDFIRGEREFYAGNDIGPSGRQRRAYAAVYTPDGEYAGFVMAVILRQNILRTVCRILAIYLLAAAAVIGVAAFTSVRLSEIIKRRLLGYEPDIFSAMFRIRDNILDALEEGILAIDSQERIVYVNSSAKKMLRLAGEELSGKQLSEVYPASRLGRILRSGEKEFNVRVRSLEGTDILSDRIPIEENGHIAGAIGLFRNRTEYTRLMEDLTGVRYLVESMRANTHDFTNKLHVILGLIQMERYEEATGYIMNISMVQRETIHAVMEAIEEPSIAALLIGKHARASELDIRFTLKKGSSLPKHEWNIPSGALITILGNLLDNAMDSLNRKKEPPRQLTVGIFADAKAMLISVEDTGEGIAEENLDHIFENGYSTKGEGRGSGLHLVKSLAETYGGSICVESEEGEGTAFTVSFYRQDAPLF